MKAHGQILFTKKFKKGKKKSPPSDQAGNRSDVHNAHRKFYRLANSSCVETLSHLQVQNVQYWHIKKSKIIQGNRT